MAAVQANNDRSIQISRKYGGVLTKDLVSTYVRFRLERGCHLGHMVDAPAYERVLVTAAYDTLNSLGRRAAESNEGSSAVERAVEHTFASGINYWNLTPPKAVAFYYDALQNYILPDSLVAYNTYSWAQIALVFEVTAKVAKLAAKRGNKERAQDFINWCIFFLKNYGGENWVECKGGWEQIAKEATRQGLSGLFTTWQAPDEISNKL